MYLLLIFLSLTGSFIAKLFGRQIGFNGSTIITTSCLFISFLIYLFVFYEVSLLRYFFYIKLSTWISSDVLHIDWGFVFQCLIMGFILFVALVGVVYLSSNPTNKQSKSQAVFYPLFRNSVIF